jgi:hypothetical protein
MMTTKLTRWAVTAALALAIGGVPATLHAQDRRPALVIEPTGLKPKTGHEAIDNFTPRVEAFYEGGECRVRDNAPMAARIVSIGYPTQDAALTKISLWFDEEGEIVRYIEVRMRAVLRGPDLDSLIEASSRAPTTTIQLEVNADRALAVNTGGDGPVEGVTGKIEEFDEGAPFQYLRDRLEQVRRTCLGG